MQNTYNQCIEKCRKKTKKLKIWFMSKIIKLLTYMNNQVMMNYLTYSTWMKLKPLWRESFMTINGAFLVTKFD